MLSQRIFAAIIGLVAVPLLFSCAKPTPASLSGKLTLLVRPPDRAVEPVAIETPGALPVQSGGAMCLDVQLNEPAFIYVIWIDSAGQLVPLYPWNNEHLEITDINQPPPVRRPSKLVFSPLLGKTWMFGSQGGTETVLLLASRTPMPKDLKISKLLKTPAPSTIERATEVVEIQHQRYGTARLNKSQPAARVTSGMPLKDAPLSDFISPLADYFDFIKAVQFSHVDAREQSPLESR